MQKKANVDEIVASDEPPYLLALTNVDTCNIGSCYSYHNIVIISINSVIHTIRVHGCKCKTAVLHITHLQPWTLVLTNNTKDEEELSFD